MHRAWWHDDSGQAFPLYITAVAGLLFLAVAYFAVGQAASTRNSAQGAADAAALAAAYEGREQLNRGLLDSILDPDAWEDWLNGEGIRYGEPCSVAAEFAAKNDAELSTCDPADSPLDGFSVTVRTKDAVGDTIVPGTETSHGEAGATAVIESRCRLGDPGEQGSGKPPLELSCDGRDWSIDPDDLELLPKASDLFTVRLVD